MRRLAAQRVALGVLEDGRRRRAVDLQLEHGAGAVQRVAQLARVDGEGERLAAAAVEDAGDLALAAQAAGGARALGRRAG